MQANRPYSCDICEARFARQDHLTRHRKIHRQPVYFSCETCGADFARRDHVLRHQRASCRGAAARPPSPPPAPPSPPPPIFIVPPPPQREPVRIVEVDDNHAEVIRNARLPRLMAPPVIAVAAPPVAVRAPAQPHARPAQHQSGPPRQRRRLEREPGPVVAVIELDSDSD